MIADVAPGGGRGGCDRSAGPAERSAPCLVGDPAENPRNEVFEGEWGNGYVYAILEDERAATGRGARS